MSGRRRKTETRQIIAFIVPRLSFSAIHPRTLRRPRVDLSNFNLNLLLALDGIDQALARTPFTARTRVSA